MAKTRSSARTRAKRIENASETHVVYVHGICRHDAGYSETWWRAMRLHLPNMADDRRHEVLWSDIVNSEPLETADQPQAIGMAVLELTRSRSAASGDADVMGQIKDVLADRAYRQYVEASLQAAARERLSATEQAIPTPLRLGTVAAPEALFAIPGLDCIDDFSRYLREADIRKQVIARFHKIVRPLLKKSVRLAIVSHSWGTVVAYEGLRLLDGESALAASTHMLFTVGSALSIGPVKRRLIPEAIDGRRPRIVRTWANLDARFDVVGGPMQGVPFEVDDEFLELTPVGCSRFIPSPACAHSSYFHPDNIAVNRDIFARYIGD